MAEAPLTGPGSGLAPSLLATAAQTMAAFSKTAVTHPNQALATITEAALHTPPVAYFLALMSAGVGAPVSEDALCIFAGSFLPSLPSERRVRLVLALYLGVVVSDMWTFFIGRSLRLGVLDPLRRRLGLLTDADEEICELPEEAPEVELAAGGIKIKRPVNATALAIAETSPECDPKRRRKRDRLRAKLENSGDYAGFVIRLSVGMRGPLMLLTGFRGNIPFSKFAVGSAVGGMVSLALQLLLGYSMRNNPAAIVGVVASIGTLVYAGPVAVAVFSWLSILMKKKPKEESS